MSSTVEWLERLVAIDTTSRDSNMPLISEVAAECERRALPHCVLPHGDKANMWCTIPAADGTTSGGIVLSGHTDCVPVDGQDWTSDPFTLVQREDRWYGRGTTDMKGFLASALAALDTFCTTPLREPIHLAFSYDEEVFCAGAAPMVADIATQVGPRMCIVGEPTGMHAVRGHKSCWGAQVEFTGVSAHSSLTNQGVNAIEYAAEFVTWWRQLTTQWREHGPFDPAFPIAWSTGGVNLINGGNAVNTVPQRCLLEVEFRAIGEVDPAAVIARAEDVVAELADRMRAENPHAGATLSVTADVPALDTPADAAVIEFLRDLDIDIEASKVNYGTEAGIFSRSGIETVVCGPGDIAQAHRADEYLSVEQLTHCDEFMQSLATRLRS